VITLSSWYAPIAWRGRNCIHRFHKAAGRVSNIYIHVHVYIAFCSADCRILSYHVCVIFNNYVNWCNFYRSMLCIRGTSHGPVSVCPCPCPSVTSRSSTKTAKRRITQTTPHDTPGTLVFWCQRSPRNSTGVTHYEGAECRWGGQNRRLSTNNRLYLENGTR